MAQITHVMSLITYHYKHLKIIIIKCYGCHLCILLCLVNASDDIHSMLPL